MSEPISRPSLDRLTAVMIAVVSLTLAGGFLLLSAAKSLTLVDGAVEWQAESPLRAVVQLLCLDYQFPTINAGEVKGYVLGMGTAVALACLGFAALARARETSYVAASIVGDDADVAEIVPHPRRSVIIAAQFLAILYVLWSFASARWSQAPEIALGGSILLAIQLVWALVLANSIAQAGMRYLVRAALAVTLVTAIVAVWYYYGRNPTLRAKFPFGNPTFLAACLIPGITLSLTSLISWDSRGDRATSNSRWIWMVLPLGTIAVAVWAFLLSGSRGAQVGLGAGLLACAFLALRGKWKLPPIVLVIVLGAAGWWYYANAAQTSREGRGESLRLRKYAWSYARRMVEERPITGYGQGGFALLGDSFAAGDVLSDPPAFEGSIDHAHNEWLETSADLGLVGAELIAAVLLLTLIGVVGALRNANGQQRWCLIGLGGALVGLVIEECAGVGLRISEVPVAFYTVLGLNWATALPDRKKLMEKAARSKWIGLVAGTVCIVLGLGAMSFTQLDFRSARATYEMQQRLSQGKVDEAAEIAERGLWRLSPQRALAGRFAAIDAYVRWAEHTIHRATDREEKARGSEPPDARVLNLAQADRLMAEEAAKKAGHALKELVERSPGYFNSAMLEFRIHLVRAQAGLLGNDREASQASRKNAVAALERELTRQPFRSDLAASYARFARPEASNVRILTVLARPLRYGPITDEVAQVLQQLGQVPDVQQVLAQSISQQTGDPASMVASRWLPEVLRMSAAVQFLGGQYEQAAAQLDQAARLYADLPRPPTLGEGACRLEQAEAVFYAYPEDPAQAIRQAQQAIELAPRSRLGRELSNVARQRLVSYYLAADEEDRALSTLATLMPSLAKNAEASRRELSAQYRQMAQSLLFQRREAMVLRKPADTLFSKLERWMSRAIELNPTDFAAHYMAADLALHAGDDAGAAGHIRAALQLGLNDADARRFVQLAVERNPQSAPLRALAGELRIPLDLASDKKAP